MGKTQVAWSVHDARNALLLVPGRIAHACKAVAGRWTLEWSSTDSTLVCALEQRQDSVVLIQHVRLPLQHPGDDRRMLAQPRIGLCRPLDAALNLGLR